MRATAAFALLAVGSALGACGGESPTTSGAPKSELEQRIDRARRVSAADFPAPRRRSLQEIADGAEAGPQLGLATSVFVPGRNRLAFGVLGADNEPIYGRSAAYVAPTSADEGAGRFRRRPTRWWPSRASGARSRPTPARARSWRSSPPPSRSGAPESTPCWC